jgi:ribosomal protein S8E
MCIYKNHETHTNQDNLLRDPKSNIATYGSNNHFTFIRKVEENITKGKARIINKKINVIELKENKRSKCYNRTGRIIQQFSRKKYYLNNHERKK